MSTDHCLRALASAEKLLPPRHLNPQLFAAIANWEEAGTDPLSSWQSALAEYIHKAVGNVEVVRWFPVEFGQGSTFALAIYTDTGVLDSHREAVYRAWTAVAQGMSLVLRQLPDRTLERLGLGPAHSSPLRGWMWALFRLAWHFPGHFASGAVFRCRMLRADQHVFCAQEEMIQLGGVVGNPTDCFPGLVFSRFPATLDLLAATEIAIGLLREAVQGGNALVFPANIRDQFRHLHREFVAAGSVSASLPPGRPNIDAALQVLRLASSFHTRPASAWAGYQMGGAIQQHRFLSRSGAVKEVCVVRGGMTNQLVELADRAGALLPSWPTSQYPAILADAGHWLMRVARRREWEAREGTVEIDGQAIPAGDVARHLWETEQPSLGAGGLVTDDRANVERWIGFVLSVLKERQPEAVDIRTVPEDGFDLGFDRNAVLTLRDMNIFQASARALELTGIVQNVSLGELKEAGQNALHHGLATLDQIGIGGGESVEVTGLSCKLIAGTTPTACPDAKPAIPPSLLPVAEQAIRRLYQLPTGTTIHWVGHDTGYRSRCRCHPNAPFTAPFDQARWAAVAPPTVVPSAPITAVASVSERMNDEAENKREETNLKESHNSIQCVGEIWYLKFGSEKGDYAKKGTKAIEWLAILLAAPNHKFTVADLRGDPEGKIAGDAMLGGESENNRSDRKRIKTRLDDIEETSDATGGSEALEEEKAKLLRELQETDAGKQFANALVRAHHNIATQLRRLQQRFGKMPNLAAHLKATLKLEVPYFIYSPPLGTPAWKT